MEVSGLLHTLAALAPNIHWIGGWAGPRAGLDTMTEKFLAPERN